MPFVQLTLDADSGEKENQDSEVRKKQSCSHVGMYEPNTPQLPYYDPSVDVSISESNYVHVDE